MGSSGRSLLLLGSGTPAAATAAGTAGALTTAPPFDHAHPHAVIPAARAVNSAALSVAHNTLTAVTFNSERFDTDAIHDTGSNTSRLVAKTAGKYLIVGNLAFSAHATGYREARIRLGGSVDIGYMSVPASAAYDQNVVVSTIYDLLLNEYVELMAYQNSGSSLDILAYSRWGLEFMMAKVA